VIVVFAFVFAVAVAVAVALTAFRVPFRSGAGGGKKLSGKVFNDACVGPEGVVGMDSRP